MRIFVHTVSPVLAFFPTPLPITVRHQNSVCTARQSRGCYETCVSVCTQKAQIFCLFVALLFRNHSTTPCICLYRNKNGCLPPSVENFQGCGAVVVVLGFTVVYYSTPARPWLQGRCCAAKLCSVWALLDDTRARFNRSEVRCNRKGQG